jgi:hypothetical protein
MSWVFPGLPDVFAKAFRSTNILISDDLPTLDRPMNAYSGMGSLGHLATLELLITNSADVIFMFRSYAF